MGEGNKEGVHLEPEEALTAYLMATPAVTALIGDRWFPMLIPQDAIRPAAAFQRIPGTQRVMAHDGPVGFASCTIQITAQAERYADAKALLRAIRLAVDGYRGLMGGLQVHRAAVSGDGDGWAEQLSMPTLRMDIDVSWEEVSSY